MHLRLVVGTSLAWLAGCAASPPPAPPGDGSIKRLDAAATSAEDTFRTPFDAALSPDGKTAYFLALAGDQAAVFRAGSPPERLANGGPLVSPFGLDVSSDGQTLVVADAAALLDPAGEAQGGLLTLPVAGGTPAALAGTEGYRPRGVAVVKRSTGDVVYFSGHQPGSGLAGVFRVPLAGGAVAAVAVGEPFVEPGGLAVAADDTVYAADVGDPDGRSARVLKAAAGAATTVFLAEVQVGYPAGVALSQDERTLLLSARQPGSGTDAVLRAPVSGAAPELVTAGIDAFSDPAGLHRARNADTYVWADSAANGGGTVYLINSLQ